MMVRWGTLLGALFVSAALMVSLAVGLTQESRAISAQDDLVITFDPGGTIMDFITKYQQIEADGGHIQVKGECISACTLMLGLVNRHHVCVSSEAVFAFHSAKIEQPDGTQAFSEEGTEVLWNLYPQYVRNLLMQHGWSGPTQPHPDLIWLPGHLFYSSCQTN